MARNNRLFFRIVILLVLIGYVLYAGYKVSFGTNYTQSWTVDMEKCETVEKARSGWVPFMVKDFFGYVSPDGSEVFRDSLQYRVALTPQVFCNYDRSGNSLIIRDPVENYMFPVAVPGYPLARDGLLFIISADLSGVTALDSSGEILFERRFTSLISSIDSRDGTVSIGLLRGITELVDTGGNTIASLESKGSRIDSVYGTAVSSSGAFIAVMHGIDPQYVTLYKRQAGEYVPEKRFLLDGQLRRQAVLSFSNDEAQLLAETASGVILLDTFDPYTVKNIDLEGRLIDFDFPAVEEPLMLLTSQEGGSSLGIYRRDGTLFDRESFSGEATWLYRAGDAFFIGLDNTLTRIEIRKDV